MSVIDVESDARRLEMEIRKNHLTPRGKMNLPDLLDERRIEYAIPDECFAIQAVFDRITIKQIADDRSFTWGESGLIKTATTMKNEEQTAARGILLSAGLRAMDYLLSNGIELGHVVTFLRMAPWQKPVGKIMGKNIYVMIMCAGDLIGSEDLADNLRRGVIKYRCDEIIRDGVPQREHFLVDRDGMIWNPHTPWAQEDY